MTSRKQEIDKKVLRLNRFMEQSQLDGVYLAKAMNFSWLTAGGNNRVVCGSETGPASLLILGEKRYLLAPKNEIDRFMEEEAPDLGFEPVTFDWYASRDQVAADLVGTKRVAADHPTAHLPVLGRELNCLRFPLTEEEVERAKGLGAICSFVLAAACLDVKPGDTELKIQGAITEKLLRQGIKPAVLLVGTDDRPFRYRHPIPTRKKLDAYAVIGLVAEQEGLHVALTRSVYRGKIREDIQRFYQAALQVQAAFLAASQAGANSGDIFQKGCRAYAQAGFPDEWQRHHQGGAIGYAPREYRAGEGAAEMVQVNQMLAWNPTVHGAKCEDTVLVREKGELDFITHAPDWWPVQEMEAGGKKYVLPSVLVLE